MLSGRGCPSSDCGFAHPGPGDHRGRQLTELVIHGVWDGDPADYL